jgi:hypothetical protein
MLEADLTAIRVGMAGGRRLGVEHRIPHGIAMNFSGMVVRYLRGFLG